MTPNHPNSTTSDMTDNNRLREDTRASEGATGGRQDDGSAGGCANGERRRLAFCFVFLFCFCFVCLFAVKKQTTNNNKSTNNHGRRTRI